ncbi:MAG: hypothetical protein AUJ71_02245 [Candidatus Omnitrophica bacterium CG1_02_49_16]|nr:MAG: hypothetical protein AUJ71_02245 [Candidatus Omnitrophica bacterium CG1_02_49_16]
MKKIECMIRHENLEEVKNALRQVGIGGMTISDVRGFGAQTTRPDNYLILPKVKLEIYCGDWQVKEITDAVIGVCRSEAIGSGKIAVLPVDDVIRIRTGEDKEKAIY